MKRFLEDLTLGEIRLSEPYSVTKEEIVSFAKMYDPQPFHLDEAAAKETQFGGLIASGTHILALWRKIDDKLNHNIQYICGIEYEKVRLLRPLRPGDDIRVQSTISLIRPSRRQTDRGIVKLDYKLLNQQDDVILTLDCTSLVKRRPTD